MAATAAGPRRSLRGKTLALAFAGPATLQPDEQGDPCEGDDNNKGKDLLGLAHSWRLFQIRW